MTAPVTTRRFHTEDPVLLARDLEQLERGLREDSRLSALGASRFNRRDIVSNEVLHPGDYARVFAPAAGLTVRLKKPDLIDSGRAIKLFKASTFGVLLVVGAGCLINGQASIAIAQPGLHVFESDGEHYATVNADPLSNMFFVDKQTIVPTGAQNGSLSRPFSTISAALIAASGIAGPVTLLLTPYDYSAESTILGIGSITSLTLQCMSEGANASVPVFNVAAGTFRFHRCTASNLTVSAVNLINSTVNGLLTCASAFSERTTFQTQTGTFISCSGTTLNFDSCFFTNVSRNITFTGAAGNAFFDALSNAHWKAATETITNGAKVIVGDLTP